MNVRGYIIPQLLYSCWVGGKLCLKAILIVLTRRQIAKGGSAGLHYHESDDDGGSKDPWTVSKLSLHGATTQQTAIFILCAVRTADPTYTDCCLLSIQPVASLFPAELLWFPLSNEQWWFQYGCGPACSLIFFLKEHSIFWFPDLIILESAMLTSVPDLCFEQDGGWLLVAQQQGVLHGGKS
jgi:hypothetical protein